MRPYAGIFDILPALKAWELRPRIDWDKGSALRFILDHRGEPPPLVICAGDDDGDEPMFQAVPDAVSIRVGEDAASSARYSVSTPAELAVFLGLLST
jgi:trehalose-phosphatase